MMTLAVEKLYAPNDISGRRGRHITVVTAVLPWMAAPGYTDSETSLSTARAQAGGLRPCGAGRPVAQHRERARRLLTRCRHMKVMAFNGSPRKTWNTATLLAKALEGAASKGAETKLVHLYDLKFTGCKSCFACKTKDGPSYGRCGAQDELTPLLARGG